MQKQEKTLKRYINVPVAKAQKTEPVKIFYDDEYMNLNIPFSELENADFIASYPLPGKEKLVEADESFFKYISFSDTPAEEEASVHQYFHLTAKFGWINDPNGLYFLNGEWHCFFQYNPFSSTWGNMHWNHSVSRDLIHWKELGITLYPDKKGTMFSGGAVIDHDNVSGLGKDAILLFYTNAWYAGTTSTQEIAYSTDHGKTFRKYAGNPVIGKITNLRDRDPAPVYSPDENVWYLPLYLGDEEKREFILLSSTDLLNWHKTDSYFIENGRECPGLRRMKDTADGQWKWVFTEANCYYRIAEIHGGKIKFLTGSRRVLFGNAYAGQFFCNAPEEKQVYLAWIIMPECKFKTWNGCMSLPIEFSLHGNRLSVKPYAVPERTEKTETPAIPFESVLKIGNAQKASFKFGNTEFCFDMQRHELIVGNQKIALPENFTGGHLFADNATAEFFDDSGTFAVCSYLPENTDFSASGFESAEYYEIKKG